MSEHESNGHEAALSEGPGESPAPEEVAESGEPQAPPAPTGDFEHRATVIPRTVVRVVTPIILLTSIALLLQGHNLPGGGFIGGVLTVTAFALIFVIFGLDYLQQEVLGMRVEDTEEGHGLVGAYRSMFGVGLALAAGSGLGAIAMGFPFMTQAVAILTGVPLYGEFEVASAFVFDLGVYFVVVGALLTIVGEVGAE